MKAINPPKSCNKLTDVEHARALHAFHMLNGDLDATHKELKKKSKRYTKTTLRWYHDHLAWRTLHAEFTSDVIAEAVLDAKKKKLADLFALQEIKTRAQQLARTMTPKSFGETVKALTDCIRLEREIIGNVDGADDDVMPAMLRHIAEAVKDGKIKKGGDVSDASNGNGGDTDDDVFGIRQLESN